MKNLKNLMEVLRSATPPGDPSQALRHDHTCIALHPHLLYSYEFIALPRAPHAWRKLCTSHPVWTAQRLLLQSTVVLHFLRGCSYIESL